MQCEYIPKLFLTHILIFFRSVDERILQHMVDSGAEFLMEVTDKTKADVKVRCLAEIPLS